jgi:hypothetical protein
MLNRMNTLGIVVGVAMLALCLWTVLEAARGEGLPGSEILLAVGQGLLGALLVVMNAVPAGQLQWTVLVTLLVLLVWTEVARRRAVRRERNHRIEGAA